MINYEKNIVNFYSKSDMEFIHLLATRGLNLKDSIKVVNEEKSLKHDRKIIISIANLFCKVSGFSIEDLRGTKKKSDIVWIRQLAYYYIKERTTCTNIVIGEHFNVSRSSVCCGIISVQNDLDVGNRAQDFYKEIKRRTLKTRK